MEVLIYMSLILITYTGFDMIKQSKKIDKNDIYGYTLLDVGGIIVLSFGVMLMIAFTIYLIIR